MELVSYGLTETLTQSSGEQQRERALLQLWASTPFHIHVHPHGNMSTHNIYIEGEESEAVRDVLFIIYKFSFGLVLRWRLIAAQDGPAFSS